MKALREDQEAAKPPVVTVALTVDAWDAVLAAIELAHGDFCLAADNCGCVAIGDQIWNQLPSLAGRPAAPEDVQ